jgi:hypothetical protein
VRQWYVWYVHITTGLTNLQFRVGNGYIDCGVRGFPQSLLVFWYFRELSLIVVSLPLGKTPFEVQLNTTNNNNNKITKC